MAVAHDGPTAVASARTPTGKAGAAAVTSRRAALAAVTLVDCAAVASEIFIAVGMRGVEIVANLVSRGDNVPHHVGVVDIEVAVHAANVRVGAAVVANAGCQPGAAGSQVDRKSPTAQHPNPCDP